MSMYPHYDFEGLIRDAVPQLDEAIYEVVQAQGLLVGLIVGDAGTHASGRIIVNQAINDLFCLLGEIQIGNGRSAIRSARTIIEHAVNLETVVSDIAAAERYMDHLHQARALIMELEPGLELLRGTTHKAYRHRLRSHGNPAKQQFEQAVQNWGPSFRRSWAEANLRNRAERFELADLYQYYRLTSLVIHGSAGGVLGTVRDDLSKTGRTYRTGFALELAPIALYIGACAYWSVLESIAKFRPDIDITIYQSGIIGLLGAWPSLHAGISTIDKSLWPKGEQAGPIALTAVHRSGRRKHYLHVPQLGLLYPANEPQLGAAALESTEELISRFIANPLNFFTPGSDWITIAHLGVIANPTGKEAIPDSAIMPQFPEEPYSRMFDLN